MVSSNCLNGRKCMLDHQNYLKYLLSYKKSKDIIILACKVKIFFIHHSTERIFFHPGVWRLFKNSGPSEKSVFERVWGVCFSEYQMSLSNLFKFFFLKRIKSVQGLAEKFHIIVSPLSLCLAVWLQRNGNEWEAQTGAESNAASLVPFASTFHKGSACALWISLDGLHQSSPHSQPSPTSHKIHTILYHRFVPF